MLHRRPGAASQPSSSSSAAYAPPSAPPPPSAGNTAYTPLKRRESAQLYPAPGSASGSKARYPLPSPGIGAYGPQPLSVGAQPNALGLGLSSPINIIGGGGGYSAGPQYGGGGSTFDLSRENEERGDVKERGLRAVRQGVERIRRGLEDALRLDRSWNLVWNDAELKMLILKSSAINLLSLLLLSFFSVVVSPSLGPALSDTSRTKEVGMWYNLLLSWPVFAVCFWINASWGPDISRRAQTLLHPSYRHQPSPSSTPSKASVSLPSISSDPSALLAPIFKAVARLVFIADFTLVSRLISLVPFLGRILAFAYMSIITSYYCFEWNFTSKGWTLDHRVLYVQERTAYMVGFGALATFLTSLGSPLVNMSIFALLYPFFVLQALLSRPPVPRSSALPNTPSPGASMPSSPMEGGLNLTDPFFSSTSGSSSGSKGGLAVAGWKVGVPLFFFARWGLLALNWFEAALGRQLGGTARRERAGKRQG